jgi:plastocyanin
MKTTFFTALVVLGILFPVTIVPAQGRDQALPASGHEAMTRQMDTVFIQIVADADSVVAVPNSVTVSRGQVVTWECDLGEWTVFFRSDQPFGESAVGDGIRGGQGQRSGRAVREQAADGRYKYDILVRVQGGRNLRADPEVIIEPPESPLKPTY